MNKKKCSICKNEKPLTEFNKKGNGLQNVCRPCNRQKSREYYRKNKEKHKADTLARKKKTISENKLKMLAFLSDKCCSVCGIDDIRVLEFDHTDRNNKQYNISYMVGHGYSWLTILKEISKCDILCANCHRIKTHEENCSYKIKGGDVNGSIGDF